MTVTKSGKVTLKKKAKERNIQDPDHGSKNIEVSESGEICDG